MHTQLIGQPKLDRDRDPDTDLGGTFTLGNDSHPCPRLVDRLGADQARVYHTLTEQHATLAMAYVALMQLPDSPGRTWELARIDRAIETIRCAIFDTLNR